MMTGYEKVLDRLSDAEEAYEALLAHSTDRKMYQRKWGTFVLAVGSTYSTLEQAAKQFPRAKGWIDGIKHQRKTDPLLKWMQEARNAEEHQDRRSTKFLDHTAKIPGARLTHREGNTPAEPLHRQTYDENGFPVVELDMRFYFLADVRSRSGKIYPPPKEHLGNQLENNSPNEVARLQIEYLRRVVRAAEAHFVMSSLPPPPQRPARPS